MTSLDAEERMSVETLQRAVGELGATMGSVLFPVDDEQSLANAVVVGDPLSIYAVTDQHPANDDRYAGAVAYRTGRQCVRVREESPSGLLPAMPFPYAIVATPLIAAGGRSLGVMLLVWADPVEWGEVPATVRDRCRSLADGLALGLERQGGESRTKRYSSAPRFILPALPRPERPAESLSLSLVYQIGWLATQLTEALQLQDILDAAIQRIMKPFGARCLAVSVIDAGRSRLLGYSGCGAVLAERLTTASAGTLEEETDMGEPSPVDRPLFFHDAAGSESVSAYCLLPLIIGGHNTGTLALGFGRQRDFRADERAALVRMAQLLAPSIGRVRQVEAERRLAQELQQGLLPPALPQHAEVDIATRYATRTFGTAVGGDWYDVLNLPDGAIGLIIGDVEGHTPRAAATMGQVRTAIRAYAAEGHRPAEVLTRINRLLAELGIDLLTTCCCVWLDPEAETAEMSTAGHPTPMLRHPGHHFTETELPREIPLGVQPDTVYSSTRLPLPEGTTLVLYTDGLLQSHSVRLEDGIAALHKRLETLDVGLSLEALADRLLEIVGTDEQRDDDAALLIAQFLGMPAGRRQRVGRMFVHRHDLHAVRDVRRFLREQARLWDWEAVSSDLELAVTELVTNALVHADSAVEVRLREYLDRLRIDVRDSDPRPPVPAPVLASGEADTESEHGRGLLIVDALASSWGNAPSGRGKSVWFELSKPQLAEHSKR
ncbi:ATP-binding SpoIIE family protein phosphatase [Streptomyces malaysiensis]|uniref:protein-serine/threonine phosphatase n=1 Tax=Streptomyces malaysiensis subsp. samsunensis TaxID=459658 RepID=A0A9X2LYJ3_STRMQ|nr:SpoIIE family protein phosphatase [Streptomyces samsunensis]MCQ8830014.1 SpoIIE family protein phosphatase [Streptomyces samsunensis]